MPAVSGNVGAVFNGGAIGLPLTITSNDANKALEVKGGGPTSDFDEVFRLADSANVATATADTSGNFILQMREDTAEFQVLNGGNAILTVERVSSTTDLVRIGTAASTLGFYAVAPVARPDVTGAKLPSDVALASLLTALAALGLITDSTT